jgi:hypothetical protein
VELFEEKFDKKIFELDRIGISAMSQTFCLQMLLTQKQTE